MKVFYDHQIFEAQKYGGISRYFYELITRAVRDLDVALCMGFHVNRYGLEAVRRDCQMFFARPRPSQRQAKRIFLRINAALSTAFGLAARPDVYHPTYYGDLPVRARHKRIVTVYDMIHELYAEEFAPDDPTTAKKQTSVRRADHVIAISQSTKQDLMTLFGTADSKITVIHLANPLRQPAAAVSPHPRPYVLYVANRLPYKGFDTLVAALGSLPGDLDLVCFGGGPFHAREQEMFAKHGLAGRVHRFDGDDGLLASLYKHAVVFVYPSRYEGFGLPPLEAMHYGCPVIVSRSSSIPEVVQDAGMYFTPGEVDELRAQLDRVISDADLRKDLSSRGVAREHELSWEQTYRRTLAVYHA